MLGGGRAGDGKGTRDEGLQLLDPEVRIMIDVWCVSRIICSAILNPDLKGQGNTTRSRLH